MSEPFQRLEGFRDRLVLHSGDLLDHGSLENVLRTSAPAEIYHLAGTSFVATSWLEPVLVAELTAVGTARMLEAIRQAAPDARFYQASSSEMFGLAGGGPPTRDHALQTRAALTAPPSATGTS